MPNPSRLKALDTPIAQELLGSSLVARLAYVGLDGTPRLVPIWFVWTGDRLVLATPAGAPKVRALQANESVTVMIDDPRWPYRGLEIRGLVEVEIVSGIVPEYRSAAHRYLGQGPGDAWIASVERLFPPMARLSIRPTWAKVMDLRQMLPDAVTATLNR
jgi:hypothetical protein